MASLAKKDLSAPCRRCAETLQEWERFCPFCGEDQAAAVDADDAASPIQHTAEVPAADKTFAPMVLDFANTVQPDAEEIIELPEPIDVDTPAEVGVVQAGAPQNADGLRDGEEANRAARSLTPRRKAAVAIGIALALIVGQLTYLTLERGYLDSRASTGGLPAVKADLARLQTALNRADLGAEATVPGRAAAPVTAATPVAPAMPVAPVTPATPAAAPVAPPQSPALPEAPTAQAAANGCSETLAALALCPTK
ncbi:hypothetical protein QTH89_08670 [Variovorax sp. J22G21]|uniref:hypothetical protein n=1 Tax=Variovorax fucosicus TaxID=3053517 RepID=UPI0025783FF9|nr:MULTISPECIES: hypothetical protein [unclassified Variovorax]MDM0042665.1 hypothetical protein [Variovorax sp. J22R193]MDM0061270.1 hypothetical protein [Variovorax sp. J22G21]